MRERAQTVIIGAGIVGVSAAYHLAELGEGDVLVLEQGPLFETGGSTSHAPGIIFQTNGSRTMCRIAQDSVALYDSLELDGERCWYGVGGLELATTVERLQELQRRQGFARSYGLEGTELLSPEEAAERSPLLDASTILGAYWVPSDGAGKGVMIVEALARSAQAGGVSFEGGVTVTGFDVACRARARRAHRTRHRGVRPGAALRGHLGPDGGRHGRRADPARGGAASAGMDRPRARARGAARRHVGPAARRAASGHVAVLPPARRPLRRRELPARTDRHAAGIAAAPGRRDAAIAHALHPRRFRPVRVGDGSPVPRARAAACARATRHAR